MDRGPYDPFVADGTAVMVFLFTAVEGSTELWERHPGTMSAALSVHDQVLRESIEAAGGRVFSTAGDSFAAAFPSAGYALSAAVEGQRALRGSRSGQWQRHIQSVAGRHSVSLVRCRVPRPPAMTNRVDIWGSGAEGRGRCCPRRRSSTDWRVHSSRRCRSQARSSRRSYPQPAT